MASALGLGNLVSSGKDAPSSTARSPDRSVLAPFVAMPGAPTSFLLLVVMFLISCASPVSIGTVFGSVTVSLTGTLWKGSQRG